LAAFDLFRIECAYRHMGTGDTCPLHHHRSKIGRSSDLQLLPSSRLSFRSSGCCTAGSSILKMKWPTPPLTI
jgi:hypothetical protein